MAEAKHTKEDLKQMQSLPLESKIIMTKRRIEEWYNHWNEHGNGVYVSFSGGKDSTVLKHIVDSMYDDVPSVFVDTGLEYPEIKKFVREMKEGKYKDKGFNDLVEIIRPERRFDEVIKDVGYPVISKEVCQVVSGARTYLSDLARIEDYQDGGGKKRKLSTLLDIPTTTEELKAWENTPKCVLKVMGMKGKDNKPMLRGGRKRTEAHIIVNDMLFY